MFRKHIKLFAVLGCVVICAAAATVFCTVKAVKGITSDAVFSDSTNFSGENGYIHQQAGQNGAFMFLNYKTMKDGYLWGNSAASSFAKAPTVLAEYNGNIYAQAPYGANKSFIYKADMSGKNKDTFVEVDSDAGGRLLIFGNKLYYESTVHKMKNLTATNETTVSINAVDLKNKKVTRITPKHSGTNADIILLGCYKDSIYYMYSSSSEKSGSKTVTNKHAIYEYNLKKGKETSILGQLGTTTAIKFYKGSVYYIMTNPKTKKVSIYRRYLDTGKDDIIVSGSEGLTGMQCFDNKIFYRKTGNSSELKKLGFYYDFDTKNTKSVGIEYGDNNLLYIIGESTDKFLISHTKTAKNGQVTSQSFAYIGKTDYYNGKIKPVDFK